MLYYGTEQPIDENWFKELKLLADVAEQAEEHDTFLPIYLQAQTDLNAAHSDAEAKAIIEQVRSAVIEIVKSSPATNGFYDLTAFITNYDLMDGTRGWTTTGADLRCSEAGVGNVSCTASTASVRQFLNNMPAGQYILMAQGFYRPTDDVTYMRDFERGTDRQEAYLRLNDERSQLSSIMTGRRFNISRISGITTTIDGRAIPETKAAVPTWYELGDYWNCVTTTLDTDGTLDLGIDIEPTNPNACWTTFSNFRLLYGNTVPDLILSDDDTEMVLPQSLTAHVVLQRTFNAGVFSPLCLPFDITADSFDELYAVGASDEKTAQIYRVKHVRAGEPCVVRMLTDTESIDFGNVILNPAKGDNYVLPWNGGTLQQAFIRSARSDNNYSWNLQPISKTTLISARELSYMPLDPMHMMFMPNLKLYFRSR